MVNRWLTGEPCAKLASALCQSEATLDKSMAVDLWAELDLPNMWDAGVRLTDLSSVIPVLVTGVQQRRVYGAKESFSREGLRLAGFL